MSLFKDLGEELALENEKLFNEFDLGNFFRTASLSLRKDDTKIPEMKKIQTYSIILRKAISELENLKFDKNESNLQDILMRSKVKSVYARGLDINTKIFINPKYIDEYLKYIDQKLVNAANDGIMTNPDDFSRMAIKVKDQAVDTNIQKGFSIKEIIRLKGITPFTKIDNLTVKTEVVPFIQQFAQNKINILTTAKDLLSYIEKAEMCMNSTVENIDKVCVGDTISFDNKKKLRQTSYVSLRSLIDVLSYITSMMVKKIDIFNSNIIACNEIIMKFNMRTGENDVKESYIDMIATEGSDDSVINLSTGNIAHDFLTGEVGAFEELANRTYEFHTGLTIDPDRPINLDDDYADSNGEFSGGYAKYDKTPYDEGFRVFSMINEGLDKVSALTDEYVNLTDDSKREFGFEDPLKHFQFPLDQRFNRTLSEVSDITRYKGSNIHQDGSFDTGLYRSMLAEVKDYPENIKKISDLAQTTEVRIQNLINRFDSNINREYKSLEFINKLRNWCMNFDDEFNQFATKLAFAYMMRLRKISLELMNMVNAAKSNPDVDKTPTTLPIDAIDPTDYSESVYDMMSELEEDKNMSLFNSLEKAYYKEREMIKKGKVLVFEADAPAQNQNQPNNQQGQANQSTAPKVVDNSISSGGVMIQKITGKIQEWFKNLIESFKGNMKKLMSTDDAKYVIQNRQYLTQRSYNNVTVELVPYNNITPDAIPTDMNSCANAIRGITPQVIQGINNKNELYPKLFAFLKGGQINTEAPFADQVRNYYKTGSYNQPGTTKIANGELKSYITGTMIPYVSNFENQYVGRLNSVSDTISKALDDTLKKFDTVGPQNVPTNTAESTYIDSSTGYLTFEADNPNTTTSMSEKGKWIVELVETYVGACFNAVRDRQKDYVRTLVQLCPPKGSNPAQLLQQQQNPQQAQQQQEQNQ